MATRPKEPDFPSGEKLAPQRLQPVAPRGTTQADVYAQLRGAILEARFRPGELLSLRTLAAELGVSTMPVREAASRLIAEGCLEALSNRGLRIPVLTPATMREILALRLELEGLAAAKAAINATEADIAAMEAAEAEMEIAVSRNDLRAMLQANANFHSRLYLAARDQTLFDLIQILLARYAPSFVIASERAHAQGRLQQMIQEMHGNLIRAIKARDPTTARLALQQDIGGAVFYTTSSN